MKVYSCSHHQITPEFVNDHTETTSSKGSWCGFYELHLNTITVLIHPNESYSFGLKNAGYKESYLKPGQSGQESGVLSNTDVKFNSYHQEHFGVSNLVLGLTRVGI